jgi:hypothetical protein
MSEYILRITLFPEMIENKVLTKFRMRGTGAMGKDTITARRAR